MNLVYTKPTGHRRVKRQLGEVALQLSHFLEFLITAAVGAAQQTGRLGQDLVGRNDGGILALLDALFVGLEVSGDFIRNLLNALLGTVNTVIGTPSDEDALIKGRSTSGNGRGSRRATNRKDQRRQKQSLEASQNSPLWGKTIQAQLKVAQRLLYAATGRHRLISANNEHIKNRPEK
ncbi:uncharacterized protein LOC111270420 isoform X2 [Varroa jacobsoni]|nr:uncharacterized protein LOC111270420 isoform X2 [Varroa jacobsoni]XP_022706374.1 uncharacterized protein LOC111270420 isoform X2 [Varroa jacobsoni]